MTADDRAASPSATAARLAANCGQDIDADTSAAAQRDFTPLLDDMPPPRADGPNDMPVGARLIGTQTWTPSIVSTPERAFSPASCVRLIEWLLHVQEQTAAASRQ